MAEEHRSSVDRPRSNVGDRRRLSRYDLVLAAVLAAFLLGLLAVGLADVPLRVAMSSAAAVGALALVDGLFLNPPRRPRTRTYDGSV